MLFPFKHKELVLTVERLIVLINFVLSLSDFQCGCGVHNRDFFRIFIYVSEKDWLVLIFDFLDMEYLLHRGPEIFVYEEYMVEYVNTIRKFRCVFRNDHPSCLAFFDEFMVLF